MKNTAVIVLNKSVIDVPMFVCVFSSIDKIFHLALVGWMLENISWFLVTLTVLAILS